MATAASTEAHRRDRVDVRGNEVPLLVSGEKPLLLWLHGAGGSRVSSAPRMRWRAGSPVLGPVVLVEAVELQSEEPMPDAFVMEPAKAIGRLFAKGAPEMPVAGDDAPAPIVRMYEQAASARLM